MTSHENYGILNQLDCCELTDGFLTQRASNVESFSMLWLHYPDPATLSFQAFISSTSSCGWITSLSPSVSPYPSKPSSHPPPPVAGSPPYLPLSHLILTSLHLTHLLLWLDHLLISLCLTSSFQAFISSTSSCSWITSLSPSVSPYPSRPSYHPPPPVAGSPPYLPLSHLILPGLHLIHLFL